MSTARTTELRRLLWSAEMTILMEAHNGLSAKLVEEAGFQAIWASGLAISASLGVRDCNEASWTQVLEVLEFMADSTKLPILLDGDTGYGNFNNVRRLVRKLEQRGAAGVCLEDKLFPKTNSFLGEEGQRLADIGEFSGKVRAAKDVQSDPDFVVVARTEAFIAGRGVDEALCRAKAYEESGADAILVHSKQPDASEVLAFARQWRSNTPLVVVPTKYPSVRLDRLVSEGIRSFIFANQAIRTVIAALSENLRTLRASADLMSVEGRIASVEEIFRLQGADELCRAERKYFDQTR
ncbi:phosphoenolpyruvate mutase [Sorangium sp. So ce302]